MSLGARARVGLEAPGANRVPVRAIQRTCSACASHASSQPCPACGQKLLPERETLLPEEARKPIQAKLRINPANDIYEQEADRVAHAVLSAAPPVPAARASGSPAGPVVQAKPAVSVTNIIQRQSADDTRPSDDEARRKTNVADEIDVDLDIDAGDELDEALQMKAAGRPPAEITSAEESRVDALRGGGQPLSGDQKAFFEPRFGYDFSGVRLHHDGRAAASAGELGARAYTVGRDIVFGSGEFQPESGGGLQLLAHELTHVVQQTGVTMGPVQCDVLQRDEKSPVVPEQPAPGAIAKVQVLIEDKLVIVELVGGRTFTMPLDVANTTIPPGDYESVHLFGSKERDGIVATDTKWSYESSPADIKWSSIPSSKYTLIVKGRSGVFDKDAGEGGGTRKGDKSGKGGAGTGKGTEKGGGAGKSDKDKKGAGQGGADKGKTEGAGGGADDHKVLADFQKKLGEAGSSATVPPDTRVAAALKELSQAERDDLARHLRESQKKAEEEGKTFNPLEVIEFYKNLSPSDRELLRTNLELSKSQTGATELPKEVKIALDTGAANSTADLAKQTDALNDELKKQLGELARIHQMVSDPKVKKEDLEPINLNELPVFTDMMMLEGMLAGASSKSPEIRGISKELTTSIAGIREFVMEEIMWLAAEMAAGSIISALLAPATGGASVVVAGARAALLLKRLNDLRKFLKEVERIYKTVTTIRTIITKALAAYDAYKKFRGEYEKWTMRLEALQSMLERADIDVSDDLEGEIEKLEDLMIDELQKSLDDPGGLGALLEHFFIPADATEDDLKEILFNIPKGVEAFRDLVTFYDSVDRTSMEDVKTLAYKGVRAGVLLYPFVGYLALVVNNALGTLMAPKDLSDRLLGIMTRAAASGKGRAMPKRQDNRAALKRVKKSKDKPQPKEAKGDKKPDQKKADDPKVKKQKADDDDKKKADAKKKADDQDKKDDEDPKKKAAREEKAKQDLEWQLVEGKVAKLPGQFAANGSTQADLLKDARKISKAHKTVSGGPAVDAAGDKGFWKVTIKRKGVSTQLASAEVLMSEKTRLQKGRKAVERVVAGLPEKVDQGEVNSKLKTIEKDYQFKSLRAGHRTDQRQGIAVFGAMGKGKEHVLATIDDMTGLHYGTKDDPIPVHWYKHKDNYDSSINLTVDGKSQSFPMNSPHLLTKAKRKGDVDIFVGIDMKYLIVKDAVIKRKSTKRSGYKQKDYRDALGAAGFDWTGKDPDHVTDLAFEGPDDFDNLWPLDYKRNRWAYTGRWYKDYGIVYRDKATPREAKESTLYKLTDKFFKVIGFKTTPLTLGGRSDPKKP